jgi:hypothetical protein
MPASPNIRSSGRLVPRALPKVVLSAPPGRTIVRFGGFSAALGAGSDP